MKQHTIIFVPHARAKFRKWRVTTLQVGLATALLATLTLGGGVATVSYFSNAVDRDELERVQDENVALREVNRGFETSIRQLEDQLADYEQRIHKLAIVAGLTDLSPTSEAGIGGTSPAEDGEDLVGELVSLQARVRELGPGMNLLQQKLEEQRLMIASTPAIAPVKGLLTSGFGYRLDPFTGRRAFHNGVDIVASPGKEVHATGDGIVTRAGRSGAYGNAVYVSHGFGVTTRYGHMARVTVQPGSRVRRGEVVGYVGSTGRSTGYHLHYEVRLDGRPTNPLSYILDGTAP